MTLQQRIETGLHAEAMWNVTEWTVPRLGALSGEVLAPIPLRVRHMGHVIAPYRRATVAVEAILGVAGDTRWANGVTTEDVERQLVDDLNEVDDCYPELIPSAVAYDAELTAGGRPYITIRVTCLGGPTRPRRRLLLMLGGRQLALADEPMVLI